MCLNLVFNLILQVPSLANSLQSSVYMIYNVAASQLR